MKAFLNSSLLVGEGVGVCSCNETAGTCVLMTSRVLSEGHTSEMESLFGMVDVQVKRDERPQSRIVESLADQIGAVTVFVFLFMILI